jgi:hypothetical protein
MNKEFIYRYIPQATLFTAMGIISPVFFHLVGLGSAFLPMFLPITMGSLLLPPSIAVSIAIITPLVSFVFTGMPPIYPPMLPLVIFELVGISFICSELYFKRKFLLFFTLLIAVTFDRIALFVYIYLIAPLLGFPEKFLTLMALVYSLPGIFLIFITIPPSIHLLHKRYPQIFLKEYKILEDNE